jgi:hypothetical protein
MSSNHHALYIQIRAVVVLCALSTKVPTAIAIEKAINNMAVKRVENRKESKRVAGFMANFLQN